MAKKHTLHFVFVLFLLLTFQTAHGRQPQDTIRILALGNSFAGNALESYLSDLTREAGIPTVIANAYIGGCTLERHWQNAENGSAPYEYRKIAPDGAKTITRGRTILQCVEDEPWDYVSFLQASGYSGLPDSYFPFLPNLMSYVSAHAKNPNVELVFLQTWAYDSDSDHPLFPHYGNSQKSMYNSIVSSVAYAAGRAAINTVIPAGTAIQNVRANVPGMEVCRDGYHLNNGIGEFTVSCVWFEALFGNVLRNRFVPDNVGKYQGDIAKKAAHYAVIKPGGTTIFIKQKMKCTLASGTLEIW